MNQLAKSTDSKKRTFQFYAVKWLEEVIPDVKETSVIKYRNIIHSYLLPHFGRSLVNKIDRRRIIAFTSSLLATGGAKGSGLKPSTVNTILTVFKKILEFASQETGRPMVNFRKLRVQVKKPTVSILQPDEQIKLWRYLTANPSPCNLGVFLCLICGLRIGEICALKWHDVELDRGVLSVSRALGRCQTFAKSGKRTKIEITSLKSASSERKIPLAPDNIKFLALRRRRDESYVLTGKSDKPMEPRTLRNHFKKTLDACDIHPINFHSLRHTFATTWIEQGLNLKALSEILGHSSVNVTLNYYVHPSLESKRQSVSVYSKNVFSKHK